MNNKKNIIVIVVFIVSLLSIGIVGGNLYSNARQYKYLINESNKFFAEGKYEESYISLIQARNIKESSEINEKIEEIKIYKQENIIYGEAIKLIDANRYEEALEKLLQVKDVAIEIKNKANDKMKICKSEIIKSKLSQGKDLLLNQDFDSADSIVNELIEIDSKNEDILAFKSQVGEAREKFNEEQKKIDNERKKLEEEKKKIEEDKKKLEQQKKQQLSFEEARKLAVDTYIKLNPNVSSVATWDEPRNTESFEGMIGYHIQLMYNGAERMENLAWYFVDVNSGKVYSTLATMPPIEVLN